jgi:hypothetical protein
VIEERYYVRREECWGGGHVYVVVDRRSRRAASKADRSEAKVRKLCGRMNADWHRYQVAMFSKTG